MNRVLLVEDNKDLHTLYTSMIHDHLGYNIDSFHNYEEIHPDTLRMYSAYVLDHDMERGRNGSRWVLDNLVYVPEERRVLISGNPEAWKIIHGQKLTKPFKHRELEDAILKATEKDEF